MKHYFISYASPRGFGRSGVSVPEGADLYIKGIEIELAKEVGEDWISVLYFTETSREILAGLAELSGCSVAVFTPGAPP